MLVNLETKRLVLNSLKSRLKIIQKLKEPHKKNFIELNQSLANKVYTSDLNSNIKINYSNVILFSDIF
jgi:hypothetical protein